MIIPIYDYPDNGKSPQSTQLFGGVFIAIGDIILYRPIPNTASEVDLTDGAEPCVNLT